MELRMSRKERDRLKVVAALAERRLRQRAAGRLVGLSERQVRRILVRYRAEGDAGLVHRREVGHRTGGCRRPCVVV